jgi:hypothetical protein
MDFSLLAGNWALRLVRTVLAHPPHNNIKYLEGMLAAVTIVIGDW